MVISLNYILGQLDQVPCPYRLYPLRLRALDAHNGDNVISRVDKMARVFEVRSDGEKNDDGEFFNYKFVPAGYVPDADFEAFKSLNEGFSESGYTVEQSDDDGDASTASTSI